MSLSDHKFGKKTTMYGKKILLMGHVDGYGGSQTAFRELYEFVKKDGYDVRSIFITDKSFEEQSFGKESLIGRVKHHGNSVFFYLNKWISVLKSGSAARLFQPDIFVSVGLSNSAIVISKFLQGTSFKIAQDFIANREFDDRLWHASRGAFDGVVLQAPSMFEYWLSNGEKKEGLNWLPCFPEKPVDNVIRKQYDIPKTNVKLVYFGRLAGNKGLPLVLKALAGLQIDNDITFDLWGKGAEEQPLKELVKELKLENSVKFLGLYPSGVEGAELMASYDALLLCSTATEGLPLILLESMAYGLPFLATDIGAIKDCCIGNEDAILVKPNETEIAKGILLLKENILANKFDPVRMRNFYEQNFSHKVMEDRWKLCLDDPQSFFYQ